MIIIGCYVIICVVSVFFQSPDEMDEQTRHVHFESMRRLPGASRYFQRIKIVWHPSKFFPRLKPSKNKKLFVVHKELQRQCDKEVRRHQFDARVMAAEIDRQQQLVQKKQEGLRTQRRKCHENSVRLRSDLDDVDRRHHTAEMTRVSPTHVRATDASIVRAIEKMEMPRSMKDRLQMQTYTTRITPDT
jgi:hypothetical protein